MDEFSTCVAFINITYANSAVSVFVMYSDSDTLGSWFRSAYCMLIIHTVCLQLYSRIFSYNYCYNFVSYECTLQKLDLFFYFLQVINEQVYSPLFDTKKGGESATLTHLILGQVFD